MNNEHGTRHRHLVSAPAPGLERREQRLGLELHRAVGEKLLRDTDTVLDLGRPRLAPIRASVRGGATEWVDEWERMIDQRDIDALLAAFVGTTQHDIDMRSVSPFDRVLTQDERRDVLARATAA